jgi:hypothetical protein
MKNRVVSIVSAGLLLLARLSVVGGVAFAVAMGENTLLSLSLPVGWLFHGA